MTYKLDINKNHNGIVTTVVRGSQKPLSHLCYCGVSFKSFPQCASTSWSWWSSNLVPVWSKAHVYVQPILHNVCCVCRNSVLLEDLIWFLSDVFGSWKNFRCENFFVKGRGLPVALFKPNWRHLLPARC